MSSAEEEQSSQQSTISQEDADISSLKEVEKAKVNGLDGDSAVSVSETNGHIEKVIKENGHKSSSSSSSSHKNRDGHSSSHKSSSSSFDKHKHSSSSSSSKHSSSSSSSKHRDGSSSSSSKHRDGHSSSSSSSKHRDGHSSSSSSSKHREGHSSSSSKSKDGSSSSSKPSSSSSSSKHIDGHSSSSHRDGHSSSSSSSKHKDGSSSSKHRDGHSSSSSSKHRDGHSSSSSSKHRDGHSSSSSCKDKSSSSSSSDKHKDRSKDSSSSKDKSSSSSSSSKHREGSSSSSKHRDDKHKSSSSSKSSSDHKDMHSSSSKHKESEKKPEDTAIKEEIKEETLSKEEPEIKNEMEEAIDIAVKDEMKSEPSSPKIEPEVKSEEEESDDDDDTPLSVRKKETESSRPNKRVKEEVSYAEENGDEEEEEEESEEDIPLSARKNKAKKAKLETPVKKEVKKEKVEAKVSPKKAKKAKTEIKEEDSGEPPKKKKKGEEEQGEVWKWWEEEKRDDGVKWIFLEHKGPVFAPPYEPLPKHVRFYYDSKPMELAQDTEEMATFYGKMLDHDYTTKDIFNNNFWKDFRKVMTNEERNVITDLKKCNFTEINDHFKKVSEERKNRSKEEKNALKKQNEEIINEYGYCTIDKHKEKIGNFRIEPPGLFRGRGEHPKQGRHKHRLQPEDVIINCSKDSVWPKPPEGHKWKEVRHDNTVTWLASWSENIQGANKYVMLNPSSKLKGEKDMMKYETARRLHKCVDKIRAQYQEDWKSKEMRIRQRSVALYFIDKLALRAGNEKDSDEAADTVGCCSLRVEHITLHPEKDGKNYVVVFDFLGKDSIRYFNSIPVEKRVFKNLELFIENKAGEDDLFDRLNTGVLNKHLQELMEGLTAKVFRTYNASRTLSEQLELLTQEDDPVSSKMLAYNRANRAVAILCNHQRAVPKSFEKSMENLAKKVEAKIDDIKKVKKEIKAIKAEYKQQKSVKTKQQYEKKKTQLQRLEEQKQKLEIQTTDKDENKEIALGTSKLNYLDPRISVAWCKKFDVPIEKVYNKTQRDKFKWAIEMATEHYKF